MTPAEFIARWSKVRLTERFAPQQRFVELCKPFDHPKPASLRDAAPAFSCGPRAARH